MLTKEEAMGIADKLWWDEIVPHLNVDTSHAAKCRLNYEWEHIAEALLQADREAREEAIMECAKILGCLRLQPSLLGGCDCSGCTYRRSIIFLLEKEPK